jgi:hypothetical protein
MYHQDTFSLLRLACLPFPAHREAIGFSDRA